MTHTQEIPFNSTGLRGATGKLAAVQEKWPIRAATRAGESRVSKAMPAKSDFQLYPDFNQILGAPT